MVVLSPAAEVQAVTLLLKDIPQVSVVVGGATRQESVARGLEHARSEHALKDEEYVLVHDAARCLVSKELVERTLAAAREFKAVTTAVPVVDTISVRGSDSLSQNELPLLISTLDRNSLVAIQTPQVFRADLLLGAHESYMRDSQGGEATDDAMLVRKHSEVRIVEGDPRNIKVTRPLDVAVAEALLRENF
jgi:2-C-methyl-D-erythritol 4-phosphate cytidylyltransferase